MLGVVKNPLDWQHWEQARKMLELSAARSGDTINEIEGALVSGAALWVACSDSVKFVAVVQYLPDEAGPQFYVWHSAGDFEGYGRKLLDKAEQWCREQNFGSMELDGRMGWMRKLQGWKPVSVTMRKELA